MEEIKNCLLLGVSDRPDAEASMAELEQLAETAGLEVRGVLLQQREKPDNATYIGAGKTEEMREFIENHEITLAIANGELTAVQIRNLEDKLDAAVIDRTMLILDIFAQRARSAEGRLQVELAQLKYRLPRLAGMGESLSRLGGGVGTRGPGRGASASADHPTGTASGREGHGGVGGLYQRRKIHPSQPALRQ